MSYILSQELCAYYALCYLFCCAEVVVDFTRIPQDYFTGIVLSASDTTLKDTGDQISLIHQQISCWYRDKIAAISQTTFSSAFSWMKMCEFRLRFH